MIDSSTDFRKQYTQQGFVRLPSVLSPAQVKVICDALSTWRKQSTDTTELGILQNNIWQTIPIFEEIIQQGELGSLAAHLMGAQTAVFFQDMLVWKEPNNSQKVEWHQDYSYWPLDRPDGITIWIALDDATPQNGCMRYIPKSHHWGECQPTRYDDKGAYVHHCNLPKLPVDKHQHKAIDMDCKSGNAIAHHPLNCHMSTVNRTQGHRRAWSLTWLHPDTCWNPNHAPHPYLYQMNPMYGENINPTHFKRYPKKKWPYPITPRAKGNHAD